MEDEQVKDEPPNPKLGFLSPAPSEDLAQEISSLCAFLAIVATSKWDLFQMDVKNAFLNGNLSEEVYMQPPIGLSIEPNKICHLQRALYGLKQAP